MGCGVFGDQRYLFHCLPRQLRGAGQDQALHAATAFTGKPMLYVVSVAIWIGVFFESCRWMMISEDDAQRARQPLQVSEQRSVEVMRDAADAKQEELQAQAQQRFLRLTAHLSLLTCYSFRLSSTRLDWLGWRAAGNDRASRSPGGAPSRPV